MNKTDFDVAIDRLFNKVNEDYARWKGVAGIEGDDKIDLAIDGGRKYIKIVKLRNGRVDSVWGFIMAKDSEFLPGFKAGDILKAASFKAPALNRARGNIYDDEYEVNWTGPLYLSGKLSTRTEKRVLGKAV